MNPHLRAYALSLASGEAIDYWDGLVLDKIDQLLWSTPLAAGAARATVREVIEGLPRDDKRTTGSGAGVAS